MAYLRQALPHADVRVKSVPRGGHNLHLSEPRLVADAVAELAKPAE